MERDLISAPVSRHLLIDMYAAVRASMVGTKGVAASGQPRDDTHSARALRARRANYGNDGRRNAYDRKYSEHGIQNPPFRRECVGQNRRDNDDKNEDHLESKAPFEEIANRHGRRSYPICGTAAA